VSPELLDSEGDMKIKVVRQNEFELPLATPQNIVLWNENMRSCLSGDIEVYLDSITHCSMDVPLIGFYIDLKRAVSSVLLGGRNASVPADDETLLFLYSTEEGCVATFTPRSNSSSEHEEILLINDVRKLFRALEADLRVELLPYFEQIRSAYDQCPVGTLFEMIQLLEFEEGI